MTRLSVVVVGYDMAREVPRTLASLSPEYQLGSAGIDYEVIVVDNGSPEPIQPRLVERHGAGFRLLRIDDASPSPVAAINAGVQMSTGDVIGIMIDGARLLSPGVLLHASKAARLYEDPIVATVGFHLGPDVQSESVKTGYSRDVEDGLLADIGWPSDGYRLFEIASLAHSSRLGWFWPMAESNCVFVRRSTYERLGGYDERFQLPGGGLANHDFYRRACSLPTASMVVILGEGTFHQLHGGAMTGGDPDRQQMRFADLLDDYQSIVGEPYVRPQGRLEFVGSVPYSSLRFIEASAAATAETVATPSDRRRRLGGGGF